MPRSLSPAQPPPQLRTHGPSCSLAGALGGPEAPLLSCASCLAVSCLSAWFVHFLLPQMPFLSFLSSFLSFTHLTPSLFQEAFLEFLPQVSVLWPLMACDMALHLSHYVEVICLCVYFLHWVVIALRANMTSNPCSCALHPQVCLEWIWCSVNGG